jgi:nucleotide-binding universal stress UspA family protein
MSSFNVILVPVDQSAQSDKAVTVARDLAQLSGGVVHLLHVRQREVVRGKLGASFELETKDEAASLLAKELSVLTGSGVKVTARAVRGREEETARAIVEAGEDIGADVIVMGSRGLTALGALVLGSTTYKVLHSTKRPVLVVS